MRRQNLIRYINIVQESKSDQSRILSVFKLLLADKNKFTTTANVAWDITTSFTHLRFELLIITKDWLWIKWHRDSLVEEELWCYRSIEIKNAERKSRNCRWEWWRQERNESRSSFFATNSMTFTKRKSTRSYRALDHAIHLRSRKNDFWIRSGKNFIRDKLTCYLHWRLKTLLSLKMNSYNFAQVDKDQ